MDYPARKVGVRSPRLILLAVAVLVLVTGQSHGAILPAAKQLERLSAEITAVENELLRGNTDTPALQIKKIRKLLVLQKKEIAISNERVRELTKRLDSFSARKAALDEEIQKRKSQLKASLKELSLADERRELRESNKLDATWVETADEDREKAIYAARIAQRQGSLLEKLKNDRNEVRELEARMIEERAELEYYVQELRDKTELLAANEQLQTLLMKNRKTEMKQGVTKFSKQVATLRSQREKEQDLKRVLSATPKATAPEPVSSPLLQLKGRLPFPVAGEVVSQYGRSYDSKTSLLTFQKGISIQAFGGTDVKTVSAGRVVYSGVLKNYGVMVIVEHPGQFYTLYGQLGNSGVKEGETIASGAIVGKTAADGRPLYFELRNKNVAINPLQWLQNVTVSSR